MKNPFRVDQKMTSGRACAMYLLVFVLMLFLDAGRFSAFLDRAGIDFPPAATVGQIVKQVAGATGLAAFSESETRLVAGCSPDWRIGTVESPEEHTAAVAGGSPASTPESMPPSMSSAAPSVEPPPPLPSADMEPALPAENIQKPTEAAQPGMPSPPARAGREKPLVLLIGDSMMMEGFGPVLQRTLRKRPDMDVVREGKYSTGLSRQDYFDWPGYLEELVGKYDPDLIVICMGANDAQDIIDGDRKRHHADSESWKTIYRGRAERLLAIATSKGAKVVWAGLPIMGKEPYATRIRRLSELQRQACETYNGVFVDTVRTLADAQGNYTTFAEDNKGKHVRLRYKDMVHVTEDGGAMLSAAVEPAVEKTLGLGKYKAAGQPLLSKGTPPAPSGTVQPSVPPQGTSSVAAQAGNPFTVDSAQRGEKVACYAFLPADRKPEERFPVVYLLHGAFEGGDVWNAQAGSLLTKLATRERLIFIAPSCGKTGWYADSPYQKKSRMESFFMKELLPQVERTFPVLPRRGVMGMSMGGHGAFVLSLRHPGTFSSASSISGVLDITRHSSQWKIRDVLGPMADNAALWNAYSAQRLLAECQPSGVPRLLISTGQQDSLVLAENRIFRDSLRKGGFIYQYRETPGIHDWNYWLEELPLHAAFHSGVLHQ